MKQFIYKTLLFITIPTLLYSFGWMFLKFKFRNDIENFKTFILGDSQTEFIRLEEIYNHSIHGSPYYVHYEFAKEFIEQIKGKRVYIACNYHNFSKLYQNRLANDSLMPGWRANTFQNLDKYRLLNSRHSEIRSNTSEYSLFDIKKLPYLFKEIYFSKTNENNQKTVINDTLSIQNAIQRHWEHPNYVLNDYIQITYLDKLIRLLNNNDCEVIILKMPVTNYYNINVPEEIKWKLSGLESDYNVRLLDLNQELNISHSYSYFKDYGHLNKSGDSLVNAFFIENELNTVQSRNNANKK